MITGQMHVYKPEMTFDLFDAGQAMYHPNYLVVCDRARQGALIDLGYNFNSMWAEGLAFVVRENQSEYFRPVLMGQDIFITSRLVSARTAGLQIVQEIVDAKAVSSHPDFQTTGYKPQILQANRDQLIHRLTIQLVFVDLKGLKVKPLPEKLINLLKLKFD